jgi:O-antigen/teichoic acid export membrane protein
MPPANADGSSAPSGGGHRSLAARVSAIASANAFVAALGFVGNGILLPNALDEAAFAAASLFLAAFQWGQELMGRSLNWAVLRLWPVAERERKGGGDATVRGAWSLQKRLLLAGLLAATAASLLLAAFVDEPGRTSRAAMLACAAGGSALGVVFWFQLGLLQLREHFVAMSALMVANSAVRVAAWTLLWAIGAMSLVAAVLAHLASTALLAAVARRRAGPLPLATSAHDDAAQRARVWGFSGRMIVATAFAATAAQIDLFLLDAQSDDAATARLRIAVLFATALELATSAAMTALLPQAGRVATGEELRAMLRRARACGFAIASLAALSVPVVSMLLPLLLPRYADAAELYPIVCLGTAITAVTDPLGLSFVSRDKPGRFVLLSALMLAIVVAGNLLAPGDDRAQVTAWVRTAGRIALGAGIVWFVLRDARADRREASPSC